MRTSGSTGRPVEIKGTTLTERFRSAVGIRYHLWHERDLSRRSITITSMKPGVLEKRPRSWAWGVRTGRALTLNKSLPDIVLLERLLAEDPDYLQVPPSTLRGLIVASQEIGLKPNALREARCFSEPVDPGLRELCESEWGVKVSDNYSSMELTIMALQCPEQQHLHVQAENCLIEVIDTDGRPCESGQTGDVVVTSLNNYATPLIRYRNGDVAEVGGPCSCGRGLPVLKRVLGRTRNQILLPSGERVTPSFVGEPILNELPIRQLQIIQKQRDLIQARLVASRKLTRSERDRFVGYFNRSWSHEFQFRFVYVDEIPRLPSGKYESVRNELERDGAPMTRSSKRNAGIGVAAKHPRWPASFSFVCFGARFRVDVSEPSLLNDIKKYLPPNSRSKEVVQPDCTYTLVKDVNCYTLCRGLNQLKRLRNLEATLAVLQSDLHFHVALFARRKLFVHAGVVGWNGGAIVIPGRSMSGKSTLVDALVSKGATYLSDEYAVLDANGMVHPYPKMLTLRTTNKSRKRSVCTQTFSTASGALPLSLVVHTKYRKGARFHPQSISRAQAMLTLLDNTVLVREKPKYALRVLQAAVADSTAIQGDRGDARRVAASILEQV